VRILHENGVTVKTGAKVVNLITKGARITEVATDMAVYSAESVIVATGGLSHPETGSSGDGFAWLEWLGHTVEKPNASLVPLKSPDTWVHALSGVTLEAAKITFFADGVRAFAKTGRILFTHFGLSGPLIINSAKDVGEMIKNGKSVTATIDLFPADDFAQVDRRVLGVIEINKNKLFRNIIGEIVPAGMSEAVFSLLHLADADTKAHSLTIEERKRFVHLVKSLPLTISGLMGLDRAIVSDGGVALDEIDTREMRSRKIENLFITGDMLNVNRRSGGYSLQLCWTTGYVAGMWA
jgi:predicted Rossmann fold flavoprotein